MRINYFIGHRMKIGDLCFNTLSLININVLYILGQFQLSIDKDSFDRSKYFSIEKKIVQVYMSSITFFDLHYKR